MDIVVLLKQVPDTEAALKIEEDGLSVNAGGAKWVINPYDEYAVEEALKIKEAHGGSVTAVSLGPEKAVEAIRTALAMGADKGVRVDDQGLENADGLAKGKALAAAVKSLGFDLVICGQRAVDDDSHFVGSAVAQFLDIPQISSVIKVEVDDGSITCTRTVEGGKIVTKTPLPALFTTQKGLNEPRFASMMGIMKAKKKPIDVMTAQDLGLGEDDLAPKTIIKALKTPPERTGGTMISGDSPAQQAAELVKALQQAKVL